MLPEISGHRRAGYQDRIRDTEVVQVGLDIMLEAQIISAAEVTSTTASERTMELVELEP